MRERTHLRIRTYIFPELFFKRQKGTYVVLISTFYSRPADSSFYTAPLWVLHVLSTDNDHLSLLYWQLFCNKMMVNRPNKYIVSLLNCINISKMSRRWRGDEERVKEWQQCFSLVTVQEKGNWYNPLDQHDCKQSILGWCLMDEWWIGWELIQSAANTWAHSERLYLNVSRLLQESMCNEYNRRKDR